MFKKIVAIASSIIVSTICLTGCDFNSNDKKDESSSSKNLDKVTIAEVTHSVFYAPQYAAITKGFFEDEGIKVDLINTQGADKTMAALISGEANVGLMALKHLYMYIIKTKTIMP